MKAPSLLFAAALAAACSSGPTERRGALDERQERIQGEGRGPHGDAPAPGASAVAEQGPVENDFDQDRDGISDADEVRDKEADNTARNQHGSGAPTPLDQSNASSDVEITQSIRQKVIDSDQLSFNAKNVKIITVGGKVTLRGPVETFEERTIIERSARAVPGVVRIDNQLSVKE